jgi:hypothetical protein
MSPRFMMHVSQPIKFSDKALKESLIQLMSPSQRLRTSVFLKCCTSRYFLYIIKCICVVFLYLQFVFPTCFC